MRDVFRHGAASALAALAALVFASTASGEAPRARTDAGLAGAIACSAIESEDFTRLPDAPTAIVSARAVPAGQGNEEYCAVTGVVQPQVQFELRLPTRTWNGRYFQTGCGGLCGIIPIESCADAQARGFAVAAQNMGHVGHFWRDALWASVPQLREDFGRRSTHVVAIAAKEIIARFYGARAAYSYFRGCSTGGREGLMEAQYFPADFDGVLAGDPAFPGRLGAIANNWDAIHLLDDHNAPVLPNAKLQVLADAVMNACDGLDGLRDGIIDDPRQCRFDPRTIACAGRGDGARCLNAAQVRAAQALYAGAHNSRGVALAPGGAPYGSELEWSGPNRRSIAEAFLRYLAFPAPRPDFNYRSFNFDTDVALTEASARTFDPVPPRTAPDLSAFSARGGRLIVYHGWADPGVAPFGTLDYYAQVSARQGGLEAVRNWFRVFMVPGMYHCRGGNAPNTFDLLSPLVRWVEGGEAPDGIIATQTRDGAVVRQRPLYAYPNVARYDGSGDVNEASNWRRAAPPRPFNDLVNWNWGPPPP